MPGEDLFSWHVTEDTTAVIVRVAGEIDLASEEDFATALGSGLAASAPIILLDLTGVTFLGSAALHVMLEANRDAEQKHRSLRVAHGGSFAARVLGVAGLDQVLAVFETVESALSSSAGEPPNGVHKLDVRNAF
ncbi:anti-anti-sigma factor [Kibdelosporangium banguiense]|uniref:Anti-sigma factor antagonist n=1 Tax=Kibdelosporangium banguiense TaxID=1365924 RepID=A0ABS4TMR2_9PSEU|nr:STAS domain-containing protein [Kibdelosporangium banguiense]MBP2325181.1 anti-anti-sigma factor [Kibdelosporangium banguiense]